MLLLYFSFTHRVNPSRGVFLQRRKDVGNTLRIWAPPWDFRLSFSFLPLSLLFFFFSFVPALPPLCLLIYCDIMSFCPRNGFLSCFFFFLLLFFFIYSKAKHDAGFELCVKAMRYVQVCVFLFSLPLPSPKLNSTLLLFRIVVLHKQNTERCLCVLFVSGEERCQCLKVWVWPTHFPPPPPWTYIWPAPVSVLIFLCVLCTHISLFVCCPVPGISCSFVSPCQPWWPFSVSALYLV